MSLLDQYDKTWEMIGRGEGGQAMSTTGETQSKASENSKSLDIPRIMIQENGDTSTNKSSNTSVIPIQEKCNEREEPSLKDGEEEVDDGQEVDEVSPPAFQKIMDVTEMETKTGQSIVTRSRRFRKPKKKGQKFHSYIALCRRKLDEMGMLVSINLEINSPILRRAFATVLKDVERINLDADPIIIPKPFEVLWYRQEQMADYCNKIKGKAGEGELTKIKEFLDTHLEEIREEYQRNVTHNKITSAITWTIFPPGEIIVTNTQNNSPAQCFHVRDCKTFQGGLKIKCSMCQFNGKAFGTSKRLIHLILPTNAGSYPISDLNVYPLKYHPNAEALKKRLINRGHRYEEIVRRAHMNYQGTILALDPIMGEAVQVNINGRVMVDYAMYTRHMPSSAARLDDDPPVDIEDQDPDEEGFCPDGPDKCPRCKINKQNTDGKRKFHERITIGDEEALLCPAHVRGFSLTDKIWAEFRVDRLSDIEWNDKAYNRLEMDEEFKEVIEALVSSHTKHAKVDSNFDDIIAGKGLGLVFLLQGPPGLGKTLTAESVAEQCHRPLYSVTSGELGTTVQDMEAALQKAFRIAKEWEAILLLDEADVFLSKRSADHLEKNAFVSVFLRLMEYYQGILFLTTNRAEEFDPAFLSRIHLILDYNPLDATRRSRIWQNLAERIPKDESLNEKGFEILGKQLDINGREIKNLLRTAWSLANQNGELLLLHRIKQVAQLSRRFSGNWDNRLDNGLID